MNQNEKTLNALAYAGLTEAALIAKLARKFKDSLYYIEQCRMVINSTYPNRGQLGRLSDLLWNEHLRQEPIRNERKALRMAAEIAARPYTYRLRAAILGVNAAFRRKNEWARHAHNQFDAYIKTVFDTEILALMELTSQDCRSYRVDVLDCGIRPAISAVVKVNVEGNKGSFEQTFLLYKTPGTSVARSVRCESDNVKSAWAEQVPQAAMALRGLGYTFRTDFDSQEIVATGLDGEQRFPWKGAATDE